MTDNPTPNDIALLREALKTLRDRCWFIIGVNDPAIVAADAALAPGQHDGAAIPAGMKPWAGGNSAPEDWDYGDPVLLRKGWTVSEPARWNHSPANTHPHDYDIIAYTPKPSTEQARAEGIIAAIHARKAIYEGKRDHADPFADDDRNRHEAMQHTVEAFDYLLHDISATPTGADALGDRL